MSQRALVVGVFSGGVATFVAPDGRPMTTGTRKLPVVDGFLDFDGSSAMQAQRSIITRRTRQSAEAMAIEHLSVEWKKRAAIMRGRLRRGEPLSSNLADL